MAANDNTQQVILEIIADTSGIEQNVEGLKKLLNDLDGSGDKIFSDGKSKTVKELNTELVAAGKNLQKLSEVEDKTTDEFKKNFEAAKQAVSDLSSEYTELNKKQEDLNKSLDEAKFQKLDGFTQLASGGAAAVAGLAGGMELFGINSETAVQSLAKINALFAFVQGVDGIKQTIQGFKQWKDAASAAALAQEELNTIQGVTTTVTTASTGATKLLGLALRGLGIGLIVAALAFLVSNFDSIKASIQKILPAGADLGKMFDTIKSTVVGVGSALVQFIIAPFKAIYTLFTDGMSAAVDEYKNGLNIAKNFREGYQKQELNNQQSHNEQLVKNTIEANKRIITEQEALGKDMTKLKDDNLRLELSQLKSEKDIADKKSEIITNQNTAEKKAQDERDAAAKDAEAKRKAAADALAAKRKTELDALKTIEDNYLKQVAQSTLNDRDKEIDERQRKYDLEKAMYVKYGKDISTLTDAFKLDEANINKKYDDKIQDALAATVTANLSEYDKKIEDVKKKYADLFKNANPDQLLALATAQQTELDDTSKQKDLKNNSNAAKVDLANTINANSPLDKDTPDNAYNKKAAILAAERKAEDEDYALKLDAAKNNADELTQIEADHTQKVADFGQKEIDNKKALNDADKALQQAKAETFDKGMSSAANSLNTFAQVLGESTAAGKALSIASATISAIQGAVASYTSMAAIPIVGPALGVAAAAASLAAGYANIKKIVAVKVPGQSSAGSATPPSIASAQAPVVASAINSGAQDVRVVNDFGMNNIKAYVVQDELTSSQKNSDFLNNLSTFGG